MERVLPRANQQLLPADQRSQPAALTVHERLRLRCILDAVSAVLAGISGNELHWVLRDCDHPPARSTDRAFTRELFGKGFWRIDKELDPELRHTVLTMVAFSDLDAKVRQHGGDREKGIAAFLDENCGEGWMLPETLRLADFGLGHDERSHQYQPVATRLGPRFFDWQLLSTPGARCAEIDLHDRHVSSRQGLSVLIAPSEPTDVADPQAGVGQGELFSQAVGDGQGTTR
jgi:hypothetical protein